MSVVKVESFDVDIGASLSTYTLSNDVGSLSDAFIRKITSTDKATGPVGNTGNTNPVDAHCGIQLTGTDTLTFYKGSATSQKQVGEVWRYTGAPGGIDEFIVRGSYAITLTGTTATQAVTGLVDRNRAVPIFNGLSTTNASTSDYDASTVGVHINASGEIVVERRSTTGTLVVYVTVVEFTGSNWIVGHARSNSHDAVIDTVTLRSDSTGVGGSVVDMLSWDSAMILEASMSGDSSETGIADVLALVAPAGTTQVTLSVVEADSGARNDGNAYIHAIYNPGLIVTRSQNTNFPEGNNSYVTTGFPAGTSTVTPLDELAMEWFVSTSGTGTAHARGRLTARVTAASGTVQTWVHRSGNNVRTHLGIINLSGIEGVVKPIVSSVPDVIQTDAENIVITGINFQASQGAGKVEIWSDQAGTVKAVQTIDSWSDISIQFDVVATGISEGTRYLVVTDDAGVSSSPIAFTFGLPSYRDELASIGWDHIWTLDGVYDDSGDVGGRPMTQAVQGTQNFVSPITDDAVNAVQFVGSTSRRECADNNEMNLQNIATRTMGGWVTLDDIQKAMSTIYKEGGSVNNLAFIVGYGNALMAQLADTGDDNAQAYSDFKLKPQRPYLILFRYDYTGSDLFELLIDGIVQSESSGNPLTATDLDAHSGDNTWGQTDTALEMGGTDVSFINNINMILAYWLTNRQFVSDADCRRIVFEKGALPDFTITSDTPANMQAQLDTIADSVRRDWPCCIRVEKPVGATDLNLDADNITFEEGASIHVQWLGSGNLNWKNLNGSDASIASELGEGTITFINPATLTLTGIENPSEVRIYEAGTLTEIAGQESVTTGSFSASVEVVSVDIVIHALGFLNQRVEAVDTTSSVSLPIQQRIDRQYLNP